MGNLKKIEHNFGKLDQNRQKNSSPSSVPCHKDSFQRLAFAPDADLAGCKEGLHGFATTLGDFVVHCKQPAPFTSLPVCVVRSVTSDRDW